MSLQASGSLEACAAAELLEGAKDEERVASIRDALASIYAGEDSTANFDET